MSFKTSVIFVLMLLMYNYSEGQTKFKVSLEIPKGLDIKKWRISYNDGKVDTRVENDLIINNKIIISGLFYSRYVMLTLYYPTNNIFDVPAVFYFNEKPASIILFKTDSIQSPFENCKLINVYDFKKEKAEMDKSDSVEVEESHRYILALSQKEQENLSDYPAILKELNKKSNNILEKNLDYIGKNSNSYYSFSFFKRYINAFAQVRTPDSLFSIFKTFPDSFRLSEEGTQIKNFIAGKVAFNNDAIVPNLEAKDINGRKVALSSFIGKKYVLLVFWATWCAPCRAEIPAIRSIRKMYSSKDLEIISVSKDEHYAEFLRVIKEEKMNWIHIFNNSDFNNAFCANDAIPVVCLIDKYGKIAFKTKLNDGNDVHLSKIKEILKKGIPN